jgi:hypothetical protein
MKTIFILAVSLVVSTLIYGQNDTLKSKKDTTRIVVGKKEIKIVDTDQGTDIKVREKNHKEENDTNFQEFKKQKIKKFSGHWSGIDLGFDNYLNKNGSTGLSANDEFMRLKSNRSIGVSINFFQHSVGLIGNNFGLVTGLGLEFNNYFFDHNNSISKDSLSVVIPKTYTNVHLDKSKLEATYLVVPLIFEFQFPGSVSRSKRFRIAAGVIGSLKLESHTKVLYPDNGRAQKDKVRDDFSMNFLRYCFTGRIGLNKVNLYANYYPVRLFEKDKGPELYPISVGLSFALW